MSENFNLDEKVVIKNLCAWDLSFPRIETAGDVYIAQKGSTRISRGEIQAQVHGNNIMFVGTDGKGNHARFLIDDQETRVYFGFETADGEEVQFVLNTAAVQELIDITDQAKFEQEVQAKVLTQPEMNLLVEESKKLGLNDAKKIKFIEKYTGYKFEDSSAK